MRRGGREGCGVWWGSSLLTSHFLPQSPAPPPHSPPPPHSLPLFSHASFLTSCPTSLPTSLPTLPAPYSISLLHLPLYTLPSPSPLPVPHHLLHKPPALCSNSPHFLPPHSQPLTHTPHPYPSPTPHPHPTPLPLKSDRLSHTLQH